jgi:hypothetical protein
MRKAMVLGVLTLAGALASPAFADEFSGFRMGVLFSQDKLDGFYSHSIVSPSATTTKSDSDQFGYEVFGGWALNKYLAAEVGYHDGTHFNRTNEIFPEFVDAIDTDQDSEGSEYYVLRQQTKSVQASVVGSFWVSNKFSLFGRAGFMAWNGRVYYAYGDVEPPATTPPAPAARPFKFSGHASDDGFAPLFGIGVQTQLDHALVRLEYQYADIGDLAFGSNFGSTDNEYSSLAFSIVWIL